MTDEENEFDGDPEFEQEPEFTIDVNGSRYRLSDEFRWAIEDRARIAYRENNFFDCYWKVASKDDYTDDHWESNNHEEGDPILVIETEGPIVPRDALDEVEVEMMEVEEGDGDETEDVDAGNGMKTIPPEDADVDGEGVGRSHFLATPPRYEDIPLPESEDEQKFPEAPEEIGEDPQMVWWIPKHPDAEERWDVGQAIISVYNVVEWNVQAKADEIRLSVDGVKDDSHDHFENLCKLRDCEKVGEYQVNQDVPRNDDGDSGSVKRKGEDSFEEGKYGGDNWHV